MSAENEPLKLTIQLRIEPGTLGPDGKDHIEIFCEAANKFFTTIEPALVHWDLIPRFDKQLPEIEFFIGNHKLTQEQADLYLHRMNRERDELEELMYSLLAKLAERYLNSI